MTRQEISRRLDINEKTVSTYKTRLLQKLGLRNLWICFDMPSTNTWSSRPSPSGGMSLVIRRGEQGSELSEAALEFGPLFVVQRLTAERLHQRSCRGDEDENIRSKRHDMRSTAMHVSSAHHTPSVWCCHWGSALHFFRRAPEDRGPRGPS